MRGDFIQGAGSSKKKRARSGSSARIESVSSATGQMREYFEAGTTAQTGSGVSVPVAAQTAETDGVATATLTLGNGAGGASSLSYSATFGIAPTTEVLGIPLYDYAAVAGGAGLVALVWMLGVYAFIAGIVMIALAIRLRSA